MRALRELLVHAIVLGRAADLGYLRAYRVVVIRLDAFFDEISLYGAVVCSAEAGARGLGIDRGDVADAPECVLAEIVGRFVTAVEELRPRFVLVKDPQDVRERVAVQEVSGDAFEARAAQLCVRAVRHGRTSVFGDLGLGCRPF